MVSLSSSVRGGGGGGGGEVVWGLETAEDDDDEDDDDEDDDEEADVVVEGFADEDVEDEAEDGGVSYLWCFVVVGVEALLLARHFCCCNFISCRISFRLFTILYF